ncbi:MAG: type II secretion system protein [Patescibacteria group bacterium]
MKTTQKGFTLIELLVVIAIIGLLSTMAVVSLNSARGKARDAKRVSDVKQLSNVIEMEAANTASGGYNVLPDGCDAIGELTTACGTFGGAAWGSIADPSGSTTACNKLSTATCAYAMTKAESTADYELCFYLEEGAGGLAKGLNHINAGGTITSGACTN